MAQLSILLAKPANFNQNNLSNCTLLACGTWSVSKPVAADQVSGVDLPFFMMLLTQQAPGLDHYPDHLAPHALKLAPSHTFTCRSPWNLVIPSLLCLLLNYTICRYMIYIIVLLLTRSPWNLVIPSLLCLLLTGFLKSSLDICLLAWRSD